MTTAVLVIDELDEQACRRLLGTRPIGRVGFTERALPWIHPVHYAVRGDEVVVASLSGVKVDVAHRGDVVAFEVDDYDPATSEGWCVGVLGPCRLLGDPTEVAELDAVGFAPFTPRQDWHYFAISIATIRGRRLHREQFDVIREGDEVSPLINARD
jgi:uncharacterized protein